MSNFVSYIKSLVSIQDGDVYAMMWNKLNSWEFPEELGLNKPIGWETGTPQEQMRFRYGFNTLIMEFCELNSTEEQRQAAAIKWDKERNFPHDFSNWQPITEYVKTIK
jgi:hypothetical protein